MLKLNGLLEVKFPEENFESKKLLIQQPEDQQSPERNQKDKQGKTRQREEKKM